MRTSARIAMALSFLAWGAFSSQASAVSVYDTSVGPGDLTGSRGVNQQPSDGHELETNHSPDWSLASIEWQIVAPTETEPYYTYTYRFLGFTHDGPEHPTISHIELDVSDDAVVENGEEHLAPGTVVEPTLTELILVEDPEGYHFEYGDPYALDDVEGHAATWGGSAKFQLLQEDPAPDWPENSELSFKSLRAPVWGHVEVKAGDTASLWNWGSDDNAPEDTGDTLDYIPRPDGLIPEPLTMLAVGMSVVGLGAYVARRREA